MTLDEDYVRRYFEGSDDYQRDRETWESWKAAPKKDYQNDKTWDEACKDFLSGDSPIVPFYWGVVVSFRTLTRIYDAKGQTKDADRCAELADLFFQAREAQRSGRELDVRLARAMGIHAAAKAGRDIDVLLETFHDADCGRRRLESLCQQHQEERK
jgi:hypothetical protein